MTLKITCNPYTKKITYEYKVGNKLEKLDSENPLLKYKGQEFSAISTEVVKSISEQGYQKVIFEGTDNDYEELKCAVQAVSKLNKKADENDFLICERSEKRFNEALETYAAIGKEFQGLLRIIENEYTGQNESLKKEIGKFNEKLAAGSSAYISPDDEKFSLYDKCVEAIGYIVNAINIVQTEMRQKSGMLAVAEETIKTAKKDNGESKHLIGLCEKASQETAEQVIWEYKSELELKKSDLLGEKKAKFGNKLIESYESKFKNDDHNHLSHLERMGKKLTVFGAEYEAAKNILDESDANIKNENLKKTVSFGKGLLNSSKKGLEAAGKTFLGVIKEGQEVSKEQADAVSLIQDNVKKDIEKELLGDVKDIDLALFAESKNFFNSKDGEIRELLISSIQKLNEKESKLVKDDEKKIKAAVEKFPRFEEMIEQIDSFDTQKIESFLAEQAIDISEAKYNILAKEAKKALKKIVSDQLLKIQAVFEDSLHDWFEKLVRNLEKTLASPTDKAHKDKVRLTNDLDALKKINSALAISKEKLDKMMAV